MNIKERIRSLTDERWAIGFIRNSINGILSGEQIEVDWVKDPVRSRWFADPFILDANDNKIIILAEEMNKSYKQGKIGRISRLEIERKSLRIISAIPILELDTHLSFPAILRKGNEIYIYPENSASCCLKLYKYDLESNKCEEIKVLCDKPVVDSVITDLFGERLMFATTEPDINGKDLGTYKMRDSTFELTDTYHFEENVARMAGDFFIHNGKVYRPTQECNTQYGHAVTLQEVSGGERLTFTEKRRIYSVHPKLTIGCHTFNTYNGVIVTDALGFDRPWIRKFLRFMGIKLAI